MEELSKCNAKNYCRTCLAKFTIKRKEAATDAADTAAGTTAEHEEFKEIHINIRTNEDLMRFMEKFVDSRINCDIETYPQNLCIACYNVIQAFEQFRQQAEENARKLYELLSPCGDEAKPCETLKETESVMLDNPVATTELESEQEQGADPLNAVPQTPRTLDTLLEGDSNSVYSSYDEATKYDCREDEKHSSEIEILRCTRFRATKRKKQKKVNSKMKGETSVIQERDTQIQSPLKPPRRAKGLKNSFKCLQCRHSFAHKITLDAHVRKVHEGSKRPFQCDRCDKAYSFVGGLYTHIREVHDCVERQYTCDYEGCGRVYTSSVSLQKHKRNKHTTPAVNGEETDPNKYVCEHCGATFSHSGNLRNHRRSKHPTEEEKAKAEEQKSKEMQFCQVCQKQFHSRYTLKYHMLQQHSNDMKFECAVCGKRMAKKFMLVQHMLVHSDDKTPCEHCGKRFIRKFELDSHVRTVHMKLRPYECKYCSECFGSRKTLRHHEYIHTGEKPYVCDICGQAYRQQTCLKNHKKTHQKNTEENASRSSLTDNARTMPPTERSKGNA